MTRVRPTTERDSRPCRPAFESRHPEMPAAESRSFRARVDLPQAPRGGRRLGRSLRGIRRIEQELPGEVRLFDHVPIDQGEPPEPRPRGRLRRGRPDRADPHESDRETGNALLALFANSIEEDGTRVAVEGG